MPQSFELNPVGQQGLGFVGPAATCIVNYEDSYAIDRCFGDMALETSIGLLKQLPITCGAAASAQARAGPGARGGYETLARLRALVPRTWSPSAGVTRTRYVPLRLTRTRREYFERATPLSGVAVRSVARATVRQPVLKRRWTRRPPVMAGVPAPRNRTRLLW